MIELGEITSVTALTKPALLIEKTKLGLNLLIISTILLTFLKNLTSELLFCQK